MVSAETICFNNLFNVARILIDPESITPEHEKFCLSVLEDVKKIFKGELLKNSSYQIRVATLEKGIFPNELFSMIGVPETDFEKYYLIYDGVVEPTEEQKIKFNEFFEKAVL